MIDCVEKFNVAGSTQLLAKKGQLLTGLDIDPTLERRTIWAALNPYFLDVTAGTVGEWMALGELRFLISKAVVAKVPLKFGNQLLLPDGDTYAYEMRGGGSAPSLFFGVPNGGVAEDIKIVEVPAFDLEIKADRAELWLLDTATNATTNFVYGLRIHSQP